MHGEFGVREGNCKTLATEKHCRRRPHGPSAPAPGVGSLTAAAHPQSPAAVGGADQSLFSGPLFTHSPVRARGFTQCCPTCSCAHPPPPSTQLCLPRGSLCWWFTATRVPSAPNPLPANANLFSISRVLSLQDRSAPGIALCAPLEIGFFLQYNFLQFHQHCGGQ